MPGRQELADSDIEEFSTTGFGRGKFLARFEQPYGNVAMLFRKDSFTQHKNVPPVYRRRHYSESAILCGVKEIENNNNSAVHADVEIEDSECHRRFDLPLRAPLGFFLAAFGRPVSLRAAPRRDFCGSAFFFASAARFFDGLAALRLGPRFLFAGGVRMNS